MKILLVHPGDSVEVGPWTETRWDWVVDLGWSGHDTYLRQGRKLGCRVVSIYDLLDPELHRHRVRDLLAVGLDQLVDSESVDWWDAFSSYVYDRLEQLLQLAALAEQIPEHARIFATSSHYALLALPQLLSGKLGNYKINVLSEGTRREPGLYSRLHRHWKTASTLRPSQLAEIAFDKWDTDFSLRRHFASSPKKSPSPVILLPSAYVNVSRSQVAYARMLPHLHFLLVTTRHSGCLPGLPQNVEHRSLASYATRLRISTSEEAASLRAKWLAMNRGLFESNSVLRLANQLHWLDRFERLLMPAMRVRDAWREVLIREPVVAVLSADENNLYTRLPIWLAKSRKLPTVFCDHGALNMSATVRRTLSDSYIVRGEMAKDYYVTLGGPSADRIVVGSPAGAHNPLPSQNDSSQSLTGQTNKDWIVFYSEPYELFSGRTQALYSELLPELCRLAQRTNRKVIVKLHPFENLGERRELVGRVVPSEQHALIEVREGPMHPELFARAWCSFTMESSVAVESTMHGVPCFLCGWFDASWYSYSEQYAKFSAGYLLDSPGKIRTVPELMELLHITEETKHKLESPINSEQLEAVLSGQ